MFVLLLLIPLAAANSNCINPSHGNIPIGTLQLGLPDNSSAIVTGYLPDKWHCTSRVNHDNVSFSGKGFFVRDSADGEASFALVDSGAYSPDKYYLLYLNHLWWGGGHVKLKICKWSSPVDFNAPSAISKVSSCIVDFKTTDKINRILGFTVSGETVRIHWDNGVYTVYVPGAYAWDKVNVRCVSIAACSFSIVTEPIAVNVTTVNGVITSYQVCNSCVGYSDNIFAVESGGYIPSDFAFNNWFLLTNTSSVVDGVVRGVQPLLLNCLWPVPGLQSTTGFVYFNGTGRGGCNGFSSDGLSDVIRYNLNFSSNSEENLRRGTILFKTSYGDVVFYCTNNTLVSGDAHIPFGTVSGNFYCFVNTTIGNETTSAFVGALPNTVREFVISRTGHFYINGYRYFTLGNVDAVNFNVTTAETTDFWTVAFASYADVLVNVSQTSIANILYCNSVINRLRCDQLSFDVPDGFYSTSPVQSAELPESIVSLPVYYKHTSVELYVDFKPQSGSGTCFNCYPTGVNVTLANFNETKGPLCVDTSHFTTKYVAVYSNVGSWSASIDTGNCPFSFGKVNNFVKFGSVCFSLKDIPGGCAMPIVANWAYIKYYTIGSLYVSWSDGDRITGVPEPVEGVSSFMNVTLDTCTKYNIYDVSGVGVIRVSNDTFLNGIMYTSTSGNLLGFKDVSNGTIYSITPCNPPDQLVVYQQAVVGAMLSENSSSYGFSNVVELPNFFYASNGTYNCTDAVLTYSSFGVCADGSIIAVQPRNVSYDGVSAIVTANLSIPSNWTTSVQVEYLQITSTPIVVDCSTYVCNGNVRCVELLKQYTSACKTIEDALRISARLESADVSDMLTFDKKAFTLANVSSFGDYNLSSVIPSLPTSGSRVAGRSAIEDILFSKVVTSGLGTVDADYKKCTKGLSIADLACAQYYNGIMVLPGVADAERMAMYTGSLIGGMALGGLTSAAAIPFSLALQARLNYVALQTDVLQENQKILAASFNKAMTNIVDAFTGVNDAISQTSQAIQTVATALNKIQDVVNQQGNALNHLTSQLRQNFQAISSSIQAIYDRLDTIQADQQVDRLITGRLAALNAFVAQTLTRYTEVRASRQLAQQKVNECVKSQSNRYGFCGNGTHIFSIVNAAPEGLVFLHTVLLPTQYKDVEAWSGLCVEEVGGYVLRQPNLALYKEGGKFMITSRVMFEPRVPTMADFVQIEDCNVTFVNISRAELHSVVPEYVDVNKTLQDLLERLPNYTTPDLNIDQYNQTILNLTSEIITLENKSAELNYTVQKLQTLIDNINSTLVDLKWLNRVETYLKWPWWVWLCISVVLIFVVSMLLLCCCSTGCCGFFSCLASSTKGCCESTKLPYYDVEKIHIQ
uniref:Spike glycoprotein n=1 Tax=229E-related bat coronavirus TaxID=1739614 RepID=A0A0P0KXK6_CVH22|nr:spike glycoprotein [229E-related bat coronavirus]